MHHFNVFVDPFQVNALKDEINAITRKMIQACEHSISNTVKNNFIDIMLMDKINCQ